MGDRSQTIKEHIEYDSFRHYKLICSGRKQGRGRRQVLWRSRGNLGMINTFIILTEVRERTESQLWVKKNWHLRGDEPLHREEIFWESAAVHRGEMRTSEALLCWQWACSIAFFSRDEVKISITFSLFLVVGREPPSFLPGEAKHCHSGSHNFSPPLLVPALYFCPIPSLSCNCISVSCSTPASVSLSLPRRRCTPTPSCFLLWFFLFLILFLPSSSWPNVELKKNLKVCVIYFLKFNVICFFKKAN